MILNEKIHKALLSTPLCQYLEALELEMVIAHSKVLQFSPGQIILQQGKKSAGLYIIIEGRAVVMAKILGEGTTKIATLEHGSFLGESTLLERSPCTTSIIADSEVYCLFIDSTYFELLALIQPEIKFKIIRAIIEDVCRRLKLVDKRIIHMMSELDITKRSLFGEVIETLSKASTIKFSEIGLDVQQLGEATIFTAFTKENLDEFLALTTIIKTTAHYPLIKHGEKNTTCYIVLCGAVQSSIIQNNKICKLSILGPLSFFAAISVLDINSVAILNYTTCERAILLKLPAEKLNYLKDANPQLWYKIFDLMCNSFIYLERAAEKLEVRLNSEIYNR